MRKLRFQAFIATWTSGCTSTDRSLLSRRKNLRNVAPFPPPDIMHNSSGCKTNQDFAAHGADIFAALSRSSPKPLANFDCWLDFGVGVGRLARMFKGFRGRYIGVDVDPRNIDWISRHLPWVDAVQTEPRRPLPLAAATFNAVSSVSVFTHMNEEDHAFYLSELKRVCLSGAYLFLTVCGETALVRAEKEENIRAMMAVSPNELNKARKRLESRKGFLLWHSKRTFNVACLRLWEYVHRGFLHHAQMGQPF